MRMPSSPSPWLPLGCSLVLHALVLLGGWFLAQSEERVPATLQTGLLTASRRLKLTAIFEREPAAPRQPTVSTKVEEPPPLDGNVKLAPAQAFNPPVEASLPVAATTPIARGPGVPGGIGAGQTGGATFFQIGGSGTSVVYVLDRSLSMGMNGAFGRARTELLSSLQQLPGHTHFQVLAYNHQEPHCLVGPDRLLPAQPELIGQAVQAVNDLSPGGSTNHVNALRRALFLEPEVIYFVTDADDLTPRDVQAITERNHKRSAIHVIEMVNRRTPRLDGPLMQLASINRGTYRCVSVAQ